MNDDIVRQVAYRKWEERGRPEGQADSHWLEAEKDMRDGDLPKAWSTDHEGGVVPPEDDDQTTSEPVSSDRPADFKAGELASDNK